MAQGCGLVLPRLGAVPVIHRLVADDRLAVMLATALLELDIAVPGDWNKAERDPTTFIRITLERWIHAHGGPAIRRRFLLSAGISNSPSDWAERDDTRSFKITKPQSYGTKSLLVVGFVPLPNDVFYLLECSGSVEGHL
jgi:hypothetical protein